MFWNSRDARNVEYPKPCSSRTTLIEFHFREIPIVYTTVGFHRRVWIQRINQSDSRGNLQILKSDFPARLPSQRISCSSPVGREETRVSTQTISYLVDVVPRRPRRYRSISLYLVLLCNPLHNFPFNSLNSLVISLLSFLSPSQSTSLLPHTVSLQRGEVSRSNNK